MRSLERRINSKRSRSTRTSFGQELESRIMYAADTIAPARTVSVTAADVNSEASGVQIELKFVDSHGNPIRVIDPGGDFHLEIYLEDTRVVQASNAGVIAAYLDLFFDSSLVELNGPVAVGADYAFLSHESSVATGAIHDINGCANFFDYLNGNSLGFGEKLFASIPFRVKDGVSQGVIRFETDRSFAIGAEVNMFADDGLWSPNLDGIAGDIDYGSATLSIGGTTRVPQESLPRHRPTLASSLEAFPMELSERESVSQPRVDLPADLIPWPVDFVDSPLVYTDLVLRDWGTAVPPLRIELEMAPRKSVDEKDAGDQSEREPEALFSARQDLAVDELMASLMRQPAQEPFSELEPYRHHRESGELTPLCDNPIAPPEVKLGGE